MKVMRYEAPTEFGKLAETISEWFAPIIRMWRFMKNNGITEGFAHRQTQWDEEERGDKRRRKTIRKRERQRG